MNVHKLASFAWLVVLFGLAAGCNKQDKTEPRADPAKAKAKAPEPALPGDDGTDHIVVLARHKDPQPNDPVRIVMDRFKVVNADFDPKTIEGGKATIEIDLARFHTGSDERDENLKSTSYLDVGQFATVTIAVDNVKKKTGRSYSADATVTAHGVSKTYPVVFDVVSSDDAEIRIKAEHTFSRLDFAIGTDPAANPDESVGSDLTIQIALTLRKT